MNAAASSTPVLLLGPAAEAMATRLELSGYSVLTERDLGPEQPVSGRRDPPVGVERDGAEPWERIPAAVILSPGCEERIAGLRRRWRATPLLLGIPSDTVSHRSHCLLAGADDFWLTRTAASDLLGRLRLHLRLRPGNDRPQALLQEGDLVVHPDRRQVRRGGRSIALTAREHQLLRLLLRRRGEIVTRDTILREIWPDQSATASNVIEVYIRYLRRKLEADGEPRLIHTVRGLGYRLAQAGPSPGRSR